MALTVIKQPMILVEGPDRNWNISALVNNI